MLDAPSDRAGADGSIRGQVPHHRHYQVAAAEPFRGKGLIEEAATARVISSSSAQSGQVDMLVHHQPLRRRAVPVKCPGSLFTRSHVAWR